jgi:hypothetical protein
VLFAVTASAVPRYLVVPIEDVEFMGEQNIPVFPMNAAMMYNHRVTRQIQEDEPIYSSPMNAAMMYNHRMSRQIQEDEPIYSSRPSVAISDRRDGSRPNGVP